MKDKPGATTRCLYAAAQRAEKDDSQETSCGQDTYHIVLTLASTVCTLWFRIIKAVLVATGSHGSSRVTPRFIFPPQLSFHHNCEPGSPNTLGPKHNRQAVTKGRSTSAEPKVCGGLTHETPPLFINGGGRPRTQCNVLERNAISLRVLSVCLRTQCGCSTKVRTIEKFDIEAATRVKSYCQQALAAQHL